MACLSPRDQLRLLDPPHHVLASALPSCSTPTPPPPSSTGLKDAIGVQNLHVGPQRNSWDSASQLHHPPGSKQDPKTQTDISFTKNSPEPAGLTYFRTKCQETPAGLPSPPNGRMEDLLTCAFVGRFSAAPHSRPRLHSTPGLSTLRKAGKASPSRSLDSRNTHSPHDAGNTPDGPGCKQPPHDPLLVKKESG